MKNRAHAFTLIELLVVIGIVTVIVAMLLIPRLKLANHLSTPAKPVTGETTT